MELSEFQIDYIKELFNTGLGEAANELSEMVQEEVLMSVPNFALINKQDIFDAVKIQRETKVTLVAIKIKGEFAGNGILLYPAENSLNLVRSALDSNSPLESLSELESEALSEISEIILNQIITTISNLLQLEIQTGMPECSQISFGDLIEQNEGELVMMVGMNFAIKNTDLRGEILFLQDISTLTTFVDRVRDALKEMGLEE